jgi:hypothetical protein
LLQWIEQAFDPRRRRADLLGASVVAAIASDFVFSPDPPAPAPRHLRLVRDGAVTTPGRTAARRPSAAVYRRRRILAAGVLTALLLGAWWAVRAVAESPSTGLAPSRPIATRVWVVHPGDTLWGIASASGYNGDIRPLVDKLSAEVHDQPLQVGERITLP